MRREWMIPLGENERNGSELDEQEPTCRYYEHLLNWSEPRGVKIYRDDEQRGPPIASGVRLGTTRPYRLMQSVGFTPSTTQSTA